jgi:hypothetical protein
MIRTATSPDAIAAACWSHRADELATWTEKHLVNRRDRFGYYYQKRGKAHLATSKLENHGELTHDRLVRHFRATTTRDIVGLHAIGLVALDATLRQSYSLWGLVDIDCHKDGNADPIANERAAIAWHDTLVDLGFRPIVTQSSGAGGFHLRWIFDTPIVTRHVRQLGLWLVRGWKAQGLTGAPEVFPAQDEVTPSGNGSCGAWVRLYGRHHTRDHYTRVWAGQWLEGDEAIDEILSRWGDPAQLIPNEALAYQSCARAQPKPAVTVRSGEELDYNVKYAREALTYLKGNAADQHGKRFEDEYDPWIVTGMALFDLGPPGFQLWLEWSQTHAKYQPTGPFSCEEKWKTFTPAAGPHDVRLGTLFHYAKQAGWPGFPKPTLVWGTTQQQAGTAAPASARFPFSNCAPKLDSSGKVEGYEPREPAAMASYIRRQTGGWPKRKGETLFVMTRDHRVINLESTSEFFGVLSARADLFWMHGPNLISQEQFYDGLRKLYTTRYETIECTPHYPPVPTAYYAHPAIDANPTTKCLPQFLDFFNPETPQDRSLMHAAILTTFWGGPGGKRPAFFISGSEDDPQKNCGIGKSTFAQLVSNLSGGHIRLEAGSDFEKFITRLLSNEEGHKRVVLVDNVKRLKFNWPALEDFITSSVITGHALYTGEAQRPNLMTTFIIMNGGSLSKDLAQRVIPIRFARPTYNANWDCNVRDFIEKHRSDIISEAIADLKRDPGSLTADTRWTLWEHHVLNKCQHADECRKLIKDRTDLMDSEESDAYEFEQFIEKQLKDRTHDTDTDTIKIPTAIMAHWYSSYVNGPHGKPITPDVVTTTLKLKPLKRLLYKHEKTGRFWIWITLALREKLKQNPKCQFGSMELKPESVWTQTRP